MVAAGAEAAWRLARSNAPGSFTERLDQVVLLALLISAAGGLGVLVGGDAPASALHFVYALVAIALLPIASNLTRARSARFRAGATLVAAIVGLVVILRLFQTG